MHILHDLLVFSRTNNTSLSFFKKKMILFVYLFLAGLDLHCCSGFSPVARSRDDSLAVVCRLLTVVVSLVAKPGSRVHGLQ